MTEKDKLLRISALLGKLDYKAAIKEYKIIIKQGAKLPLSYHGLSLAYITTQQFEKALETLRAAENKFPDCQEFNELIGDAYIGLGDFDNGLKYLNLALEKQEKSDKHIISTILVKIAEIKYAGGEKEEAESLWKRARELDPDNLFAVFSQDVFKQKTDSKNTISKTFDLIYGFSNLKDSEFSEKEENDPFTFLPESEKLISLQIKLAKSDYKTAIKEANKYIKQGTYHPLLYHGISIAYIATGQFDKALANLIEAENKFPDFLEFYDLFGEAYYGLNDFDNALKYFGLALENADNSDKEFVSDLLTRIADIKYIKGEEDEAKDLWKRALEINPENPDAKNINEIYNEPVVDLNNTALTFELYDEFSKMKETEFFNTYKLKKFRSYDEKKKIILKIDTAFRSNVLPNLDIIKGLNKKSRSEWFKRIEIDFVNEPVVSESKEQIIFNKEVNDRFSFLPENGFRFVYIARPALVSAGMPELKLLNFIKGIDLPDKKDIKLLKWGYEIGKKFSELESYGNNMETFEKDFLDIFRLRLKKKSAVTCMFKIIDNEVHEK